MRKVLLSTILWCLTITVFSQIETSKYLIKYLETNTTQPDYPVTFLSDTEFIYKSPNTKRIPKNNSKLAQSNLFVATFDAEGNISSKREIEGLSTRKMTKTGAAYSPDKKTVYFSAKKYRKRPRRKDKEQLYKADVDSDGNWNNIEKLAFSSEKYSFGEPTLSASGQELYFTSDMPGGIGGLDIYMVSAEPTGEFTNPINLGNRINTAGNEVTPFITKNNKLYFSSDSHEGGLGGLDVYSLDFNNPTGKPVHLDAPINGLNDDFAFVIDSNGDRGYFASNRLQGQNNHDIYSVFVEKTEVECLQEIAGVVKDIDTKEAIANATITLYDKNFKELESIKTDAEGKYSLSLDCNKTYTLAASAINYNTEDHIVNTANYLEAPTLEANKLLTRKSVEEIAKEEGTDIGDEATIQPVYFGFDKSDITPNEARKLDELTTILKNNETLHVELSSYTDSRGSRAYNLKLSERRAQASLNYLVNQGIDRDRIKAKGYGESRMVNKCVDGVECSEAAHEKNRRTEFAFVNSQTSAEHFDNNKTNTVTEISKTKEEKAVVNTAASEEYYDDFEAENVVENNVVESKLIQNEIIPTETETAIESSFSEDVTAKKDKLENNQIVNASNENEVGTSSITTTNNEVNKTEESDEAKWMNSQIEESQEENRTLENTTKTLKEESESLAIKEEISEEIQSEKERTNTVLANTKNLSNNINTTTDEDKKEEKFNFEKQQEQGNAIDKNTDPNQLLADLKEKAEIEKENNTEPLINKAKEVEESTPIVKNAPLSTSEVSVKAMQNKRGKYVETDKSKKINALRVTFRIQPNNATQKGYKDAYVVIKSPTGKIVNEKGVFPLLDGEDQSFTDQTTIYYNRQSIKAVMFIDKIIHKFTKGVYTVNIYIDGNVVGENTLTIS